MVWTRNKENTRLPADMVSHNALQDNAHNSIEEGTKADRDCEGYKHTNEDITSLGLTTRPLITR